MTLPTPNLDDRNFEQLVKAAREQIRMAQSTWDDVSPHDPGMVLVEVFAYLTETLIYRVNRLPEKVYIALLSLLGITLRPPSSAVVELEFAYGDREQKLMTIPKWTCVKGTGENALDFYTAKDVILKPGQDRVQVKAYQGFMINEELVGVGSGQPGLTLRVHHPPIVAELPSLEELQVFVETPEDELTQGEKSHVITGTTYRMWQEVQHFDTASPEFAYRVNRLLGTIMFAPAVSLADADGNQVHAPSAMAAIPPKDRKIVVTYLTGGGEISNVPAETLKEIDPPIDNVIVINPQRATGGSDAEMIENAQIRGPLEFHALHRTVTLQDYETVARFHANGIARAKAITQADHWKYATPGMVEVHVVPEIPHDQRGDDGRVTLELMQEYAIPNSAHLSDVQNILDSRRILGAECLVKWSKFKKVWVTATVEIRQEENLVDIKQRLEERLHQAINPLPSSMDTKGWLFGQALHESHVYDILLKEPGVRIVKDVRLHVEQAPDGDVRAIAADPHQSDTWYAGSGETLFRTLNNGEGWEPLRDFEGQRIRRIRCLDNKPGVLAVLTESTDNNENRKSLVYVATECGETQVFEAPFDYSVNDMAWIWRNNNPLLLLATDKGLRALPINKAPVPDTVIVTEKAPNIPLYAVAVVTERRGVQTVAVATQNNRGVFISNNGGSNRTFYPIGLDGEDVRTLAVQVKDERFYLWAGTYVSDDTKASGCFRWELLGNERPQDGWKHFNEGWKFGSCRDLASHGSIVLAATHNSEIVSLNTSSEKLVWTPLVAPYQRVRSAKYRTAHSVAVGGPKSAIVMMGLGGDHEDTGVYILSSDQKEYQRSSLREYKDRVTLPSTWLFVSGEHEIEVKR